MKKQISETRKEDNLYFKGPFWVIASSVHNLLMGDYSLLCEKELCTYEGKLDRSRPNRKEQTHEQVWNKFKSQYGTGNLPYNYFPRGRVEVYQGKAYININSLLNKPQIINDILKEYQIENLEYHVFAIDELQGEHYNFKLK